MKTFTVQLAYAAYHAREEVVQAKTLDEALASAIQNANQSDQWSSSDGCGNTFVEAVAEGEISDLWADDIEHLSVPARFTEKGEGPRITITVSGGVVQNVAIHGGHARLSVHDYDTDGADPYDPDIRTDENGNRYTLADWSTEIAPQLEAGCQGRGHRAQSFPKDIP